MRRIFRRQRVGDALLGIVAVVAMSLAFTAQAVPPPVVAASYTAHTGGISLNGAATIAEAVNENDSKFVQMDVDATITLAFPAGVYAAPDGTTTPDITVHTFDTAFRADATVQVYVMSNNGWVSLGMIRDDQGDVGLNLETAGIVNQVKLVQDGYIDPAFKTLGFDLDAITASNYITLTTNCDAVTPGPYTGYAFVSKTFVPSTIQAGVNGPTFVGGVAYKVESQGFYQFGSNLGWLADAEWSVGYAGPSWVKDLFGFTPGVLDLRINWNEIGWTETDWGAFSSAHLYTHDLIGTGSPTNFLLGVSEDQPSYYGDNAGGLCVSVFEDDLAPVVSGVTATPDHTTAGSPVTVTANVSDVTKNGSFIKSAEYKLDGGTWMPMTAVTGFDSPTEAVTAALDPSKVTPGIHTICVRGTDMADNTSDGTTCTTLWVADRSVKVSGVVAGGLYTFKDTGEPDWTFEGLIYAAGTGSSEEVWGSIHVNYKKLGETCTFTPTSATTVEQFGMFTLQARSDTRPLLNSCDGLLYSIQLAHRGSYGMPRGGVFIYLLGSGDPKYELGNNPIAGPYIGYVPLDRGNVILWTAS